ncbi:MAG: PQQ-dependent sugar dehydrogenase [Acidobacteria bacterium]|nr:PQQ-dependent sugar dehydrogenase [Acidobacteriota bacterium]
MITNLEVAWSLTFSPDGRLFVTERPGRVRIVQFGQLLAQPALVLADTASLGESGVLGLTLHPRFTENGLVYLVYTARRPDSSVVNRLMRFRELNNTLGEPRVLLDNIPAASTHDGSRVRFGPDGKLYMTMGDASRAASAQELGSLSGKIHRMNDDGTTPADNPFGSLLYSYGHRNPQGLDFHPVTGDLWESEHGNIGHDEINRIERGGNYGWPTIEGSQTRAGMVTPALFFEPSIPLSGASFYTGSAIPNFRNNFFVATLGSQHIQRVRLDPVDNRRIVANERLLAGRYGRLRDITTGPDGFLYFSTSNRDGRGTPATSDDRILRIVPAR